MEIQEVQDVKNSQNSQKSKEFETIRGEPFDLNYKINIEDIKDIKNNTQSKSQPKIDIQIQANKDNRVSK